MPPDRPPQGAAHLGFNIDASVRIGADDATGRENLARYLIRAPFSGEKIAYNANEGTVIYKTKRATGADGNFATFDPLDFLTDDVFAMRNLQIKLLCLIKTRIQYLRTRGITDYLYGAISSFRLILCGFSSHTPHNLVLHIMALM